MAAASATTAQVQQNIYQEAMQSREATKALMIRAAQNPLEINLRICQEAVGDPVGVIQSWIEFINRSAAEIPAMMQELRGSAMQAAGTEGAQERPSIADFDTRVISILSTISPDTIHRAGNLFDTVLAQVLRPGGAMEQMASGFQAVSPQGTNPLPQGVEAMVLAKIRSSGAEVARGWPEEGQLLATCERAEDVVQKLVPRMITRIQTTPANSFQEQFNRLGYVFEVCVAALAKIYHVDRSSW